MTVLQPTKGFTPSTEPNPFDVPAEVEAFANAMLALAETATSAIREMCDNAIAAVDTAHGASAR